MKKIILYLTFYWFTLFIFIPIHLQSKEIAEQNVRSAVETWVRYITADARPNAFIEKMEPYQVNQKTVAYIAHLTGGGFCLCGADDLVLPVYLYSPQGTYDPHNPNYQYILWEIETRVKYLDKGLDKGKSTVLQYQKALSERKVFWQDLIAGSVPKKMEKPEDLLVEPDLMTLNLTSHWHQHAPYNDQCPLHVNAGQRCIVGCVATAMSQIMYYWQWPITGLGTEDVDYEYRWRNNWDSEPLAVDPIIDPWDWAGRLQWTSAGGGTLQMNGDWDESVLNKAKGISTDSNYQNALQNLYNRLNSAVTNWSANFGTTTYQWNLMADDENQLPPGGDAAVATLCYHAGVAVDMDYGISGSGALTSNVEDALEDHFLYDHDATYGTRDIDKMTEEIQWLRPIEFRGQDYQGGINAHAWIVYGYNKGTDPDRQFLMNMGQVNSDGDGWYSCDNIDVDNDSNPDYWDEQHHVTYIAPLNEVLFVGADDPGDGSPNDPYENIEEAIVEAPDNATLIFKAGSVNTFSSSTLVIDRALTLKGKDVVIRK